MKGSQTICGVCIFSAHTCFRLHCLLPYLGQTKVRRKSKRRRREGIHNKTAFAAQAFKVTYQAKPECFSFSYVSLSRLPYLLCLYCCVSLCTLFNVFIDVWNGKKCRTGQEIKTTLDRYKTWLGTHAYLYQNCFFFSFRLKQKRNYCTQTKSIELLTMIQA